MDELNVSAGFIDSLTIDEIEALEDATGLPVDLLFSGEATAPKARMLRALAFVVYRRRDPDYTLEQAGQLTLAEMDVVLREVAGGASDGPLPGTAG